MEMSIEEKEREAEGKFKDLGEIRESKKGGSEYYAVHVQDTISLAGRDGLGQLLSKASFLLKVD